jgi:hypothetical protein
MTGNWQMRMHSDFDPVRLRRVFRDFVALSAVPAVWLGREPHAITAGLADLLAESLQLDFAFVRLRDRNGSAAVESARGNAWPPLLESLQRYLADGGRLSCSEIVPGISAGTQGGRGIVMPVGVNAEAGVVAAACTAELRRSEAYLAEAQTLSHTGSFGWKPDGGEIVWSHEEWDHALDSHCRHDRHYGDAGCRR